MVNVPYFYDKQLRTVFLHFVRLFSGFKVKTGADSNGFAEFITVPALLGMGDRQAHHIINQNSENVTLSVPRIACYVTAMNMNRDRSSWAGNTDDLLITERKFDREEEQYTSDRGRDYHVKRLMHNPLDITMQVDIITSNMDQKCQLFEQIYLIFNPMFEMQVYKNPLHWTPIKRVFLEDINWDTQGFPKGTAEEDNILTLTFRVEADINPPAKLKRQVLINTIVEELGEGNSFDDMLGWGDDDVSYTLVTPGNHSIMVNGNEITLLGAYKNIVDENNEIYSWPQLIDLYGELVPGTAKIRLKPLGSLDTDVNDIIGYIDFHPTIDNILLFTIDQETLPTETLTPFDQFINPHENIPGDDLPAAALGQRYILTDDIGSSSVVWGSLDAKKNDIIEYDGANWIVVLNALSTNTREIIIDTSTGIYYKLIDHEWLSVIEDYYLAGYWRLMI